MALSASLAFVAAAAFFGSPVDAGLYPKSSAVLSITGKSYDRLIAQSNQTSIVEFYAPWCGHCKNLQPAYEKAAKSLSGLAKVAAIDCDDEANKPFCGSMGVQGFPTLKIVRPGKKPGKPIVEDYQGARTAKAIVDAVAEKIPNHVTRVTEKNVEDWGKSEAAKAMLFTEKGTVSSLLKALAVDYLGSVAVGQVRDREKALVEKYSVSKLPAFLVFPAGAKEPLVYLGELKKEAMSKFITESTGISPNPDPAPEGAKKAKPATKADQKAKKKFEQSSASHKSADASSEKLKATSISLENEPTASPDPKVEAAKPVKVAETVQVLDNVDTADDLHVKCLNPSARVCILILLPDEGSQAGEKAFTPDSAAQALLSLSEVRHKLSGRGIFPFYAVAAANPLAVSIRDSLSLTSNGVEIIATNAKRQWVRKYARSSFGVSELSEWVDAIKMNEGAKQELPAVLIKQMPVAEKKEEVKEQPKKEDARVVEEKVAEFELPSKGEKYIVTEGGMHFEVEELDDDFVIPDAKPKDEL